MKKVLVISCLLVAIISSPLYAESSFTINDYQIEMSINQDSTIMVKEIIEADFLEKSHGIYRNIPNFKG